MATMMMIRRGAFIARKVHIWVRLDDQNVADLEGVTREGEDTSAVIRRLIAAEAARVRSEELSQGTEGERMAAFVLRMRALMIELGLEGYLEKQRDGR